MAASTNIENERESRPARRRSADKEPVTLRKTAAKAVAPETIIDLVQRLGLVDIVVDRLRARLEESDVDEVLDEVGDYLRRNPELIVVGLATLTVAAGAVVFLARREQDEERYERPRARKAS
jgi:hypothetical protein